MRIVVVLKKSFDVLQYDNVVSLRYDNSSEIPSYYIELSDGQVFEYIAERVNVMII